MKNNPNYVRENQLAILETLLGSVNVKRQLTKKEGDTTNNTERNCW